jgi:hypothetical protein
MVAIVANWTRLVVLMLPWGLLLLGAPVLLWWTFEPVPVTINYVAPALLSHPARTREEAAKYYVSESVGGVTLWRYVEACVHRPIHDGESHRAWVGSAMVWNAPSLPLTSAGRGGCWAQSIAVEIPSSSPSRDFGLHQWLIIRTNPIRTDRISYDVIPLRILDGKDK